MAILLKRDSSMAATYVPNTFIDKYMTHADGEFVKIYLYLLRCLNSPDTPFSISGTADKFDHTEKDVRRALKYWEKMHLLRLEFDSRDELSGICLMDTASPAACLTTEDNASVSIPAGLSVSYGAGAVSEMTDNYQTPQQEPFTYDNPGTPDTGMNGSMQQQKAVTCRTYSRYDTNASVTQPQTASCISSGAAAQPVAFPAENTSREEDVDELISRFSEDENVQELLYVAERYIGHQLTHNETGTILYWMDKLGFSQDLIDYLIEQCVAINRPGIQYMNKIALDWAQKGVHTLSEAKQAFAQHNHTVFAVRRAFGISDRSLADFEQDYLRVWTQTMGFSEEVIVLACQKTLRSTQKISFSYANSILESWQKQNVHTLAEIELLDAKHQKVQTRKYAALKKSSVQGRTPRETALTKYNSFSQRTYDYDALERELLTR